MTTADARDQDAQLELESILTTQKREYEAAREGMDVFVVEYKEQLLAQVRRRLGEKGRHVRVLGRVKLWPSIRKKLETGIADVWSSCSDLLAFKLIVLSRDMVRDVTSAITTQRRPGTQSRRFWHSTFGRSRGYSAVHLQITLPDDARVPSKTHEVGGELQILTELQETWDSVTHDDFYKSDNGVPMPIRHRIHRLAAAIDLLDDEMKDVRASLGPLRDEIRNLLTDSDADANESWKGVMLDEVSIKVASEYQLRSSFDALRTLGRECGFRRSAWPELVRCGEEVDLLLDLAQQLSLRNLGDLEKYYVGAHEYRDQLREIASALHSLIGPERFFLFDRPLFVLAVVMMLMNPGVPGARFRPALNVEIRRVAAQVSPREGGNDHESAY